MTALEATQEGMIRYGWSFVDANGVKVSSLIFKNEKAARQYKKDLKKLHPEMECSLVELFVRNGDTWDR
jgi:hypothetical protein